MAKRKPYVVKQSEGNVGHRKLTPSQKAARGDFDPPVSLRKRFGRFPEGNPEVSRESAAPQPSNNPTTEVQAHD